MATTAPRAWSASTIRNLCAGATRAKTETSPTARANAASSNASTCAPVSVRAPGATIPRSVAMRSAVRGWSPVIMIARMPARRAWATAAAASGRAGSMIPTTPANTRSCSSPSAASGAAPASTPSRR